jgi:hypothetical protein
MKESAERMDSGLSFALAGEERRGHELFDTNAPIFRESLAKELKNITLPGEGELAWIKESEERYQTLAKAFGPIPISDTAERCISLNSCRSLQKSKTTRRRSSA